MDKLKQQILFDAYPKIFAQKDLDKSKTLMCYGICCGDGWFNIIDVLCQQLQAYVNEPLENLEIFERFYEQATQDKDIEEMKNWLSEIEKTKATLRPQIEAVQVKEKFGTLRFYINGYTDATRSMISFAEKMSSRTCDSCGAPADLSTTGRWKVQCEKCKGEI